MKQYVPTFLLLFFTTTLLSQDLTGIWRGSFYNIRDLLLGGAKYRYEVQIDNSGKGVKGVTYSYQTTRFYGKASLVGMWTPGTKNLVMREEKMQDLKIEGGGEGCLMTCYLDYHKEGDKEYLEGTYSSRNMNTGLDCGGGKVYLERVPDSDFEKEDFLENKPKKSSNSSNPKIKPGQEDFLVAGPDSNVSKEGKKDTPVIPKQKEPVVKATPKKTVPPPVKKAAAAKPVAKATTPSKPKAPPAKPPVASTQKTDKPVPKKTVPPIVVTKPLAPVKTEMEKGTDPALEVKPVVPPTAKITSPAPPILKQRKNELFQTIVTSAKEIVVSFYDNGEIDGDIISVYDNNTLLVKSKGLSTQPITVTIKMDEADPDHDIVMVAENLGSIPPNTALMIAQAGKQRHTVNLSSNEQNNAMVRFHYQKEENK